MSTKEAFLKYMNQGAPRPQPMSTPIPRTEAEAMAMQAEAAQSPQAVAAAQASQGQGPQTLVQPQPAGRVSMRMNSVLPPTDDETDMTQTFKDYMDKRQGRVDSADQELQQMRAERDGMKGSFGDMDLTGLNQFADAMTGSKMAQTYNAPTKGKEMDAMIQKLADSQNKNVDGMGQDQLQFLKDRQGLRNNKAMIGMAQSDRHAASMTLKMEDAIRKDLAGADDKFTDTMKSIDTVDAAVATGQYSALQGVLSNLGRGVGGEKGPLSDGDVSRIFPGSAINSLAKLEFYLTGNAAIPPDVQKQVMTLVNVGRQNAQKQAVERIAAHKKVYSVGSYAPLMAPGQAGYNSFDAFEQKIKNAGAALPQNQMPAQNSGPQGGPMSFEQWKAAKGKG